MSCVGCENRTLSTEQQDMANIKVKAKNFAIEKQTVVIIYKDFDGIKFCTEQSFRQNNPGQYLEGVTQFLPNVTTG